MARHFEPTCIVEQAELSTLLRPRRTRHGQLAVEKLERQARLVEVVRVHLAAEDHAHDIEALLRRQAIGQEEAAQQREIRNATRQPRRPAQARGGTRQGLMQLIDIGEMLETRG